VEREEQPAPAGRDRQTIRARRPDGGAKVDLVEQVAVRGVEGA